MRRSATTYFRDRRGFSLSLALVLITIFTVLNVALRPCLSITFVNCSSIAQAPTPTPVRLPYPAFEN